MRVTKSGSPRYHVFYDMDFSPSKGAQMITTLFADGRTARPQVPGVVHRGGLGMESRDWDVNYQTGVDIEALSRIDAPRAERLVAMIQDVAEVTEVDEAKEPEAEVKPEEPAPPESKDSSKEENKPAEMTEEDSVEEASEPAADTQAMSAASQTPWLKKNPLVLDEATLLRGKQQFGIYCSVCHGLNGKGQGLVHRRAQKILAQTWIQPSNMTEAKYHSSEYAEGQLFSTITNGIRKMSGYGAQITVRDRWAIVGYIRALQASQDASMDLVPEDQRGTLKEEQAEVKRMLEEAAAAEKAKQEAA